MIKKWTSPSEEETFALGARLAGELQPGAIVALKGDLGAGKTHLVKGMAQAFGIKKEQVHSPTFSLIHEYEGTMMLYHFDCYRLESPQEALEIGAEDYFYDQGVCVIEWPERIEAILPGDVIWVEIEITGLSQREFTIRMPNK